MKYKKGTMVEVLNKREVPSGSWWRAKIISGNGHTYSVRYDPAPSGVSELVERVPRKAIRPCPPSNQEPITLMSGDVIEVFDNGSWKLAEVSNVIDGGLVSVRILGSSRVFNAEKCDIRLRQCWKDDHWIVIEKEVRNSESGKGLNARSHKRSSSPATSGSGRVENCEETTTSEEPIVVFAGGKRKVLHRDRFVQRSPQESVKKAKISGGTRRISRYSLENQYSLPKKVDAVASQKIVQGESNTHASLKDGTRFSGLETLSRKPNGDVSRFLNAPIEPELSDSSVCSSCGSNYSPMFYSRPLYAAAMLECGILVDDADSTGWSKF
ncbi:uncharacterized protein LOC144703919 isoform X2 [Wolffia australiana]